MGSQTVDHYILWRSGLTLAAFAGKVSPKMLGDLVPGAPSPGVIGCEHQRAAQGAIYQFGAGGPGPCSAVCGEARGAEVAQTKETANPGLQIVLRTHRTEVS